MFEQNRNLIGKITFEHWKDIDSFKGKAEAALKKLAHSHDSDRKFSFMNLHYLSPRSSKNDLGSIMRVYAYMDNFFKGLIYDYEDILSDAEKENTHLCSRIITQDWEIPLKFRLYLSDFDGKTDSIPIYKNLLNTLKELNDEKKHLDEYSRKSEIISALGDIKKQLCVYCKVKNECKSNDKVLLEELLTTFKLTFFALKRNHFRNRPCIDIVFTPISICWNDYNDVIAVAVNILKNPRQPDRSIVTAFTAIIQGIHHRELLFAKYLPLFERREQLKNQVEQKRSDRIKKLNHKEDNLQSMEASASEPLMDQLNKDKRSIADEADRLIEEINRSRSLEDINRVIREVEAW